MIAPPCAVAAPDGGHARSRRWSAIGARMMFPVMSLLLASCTPTAPAPPPPPEVQVLKVAPQAAAVQTGYVGQIEASSTVEIRPRVGGLLLGLAAEEGARVRAGQLLFEIDPQPTRAALARAKAALAQAQANLLQARRDRARVEPLLALDAVSRQEFDAVQAREQAGQAEVDAARAAVRTAELDLEYTRVTSPIDGVMGRAGFRVGGLVTAYTSLLTTVYANDPMFVNFSVSEQRMLELRRRYGITRQQPDRERDFRLQLADGTVYPHAAHIDFVDAAVDAGTGTLPVRLSVPNPDELLISGQFARVLVESERIEAALLLPQRAVQEVQGRTSVWVIGPGDIAQPREVTMGARIDTRWLVQQGLEPGEHVVIEGMQKLRPGMAVKANTVPDAVVSGTPTAP